jgi:PadR family transcriptional regulator, regulatory protein PadR
MATDLGMFELLVLMATSAHDVPGELAYGVVIRRSVAASRGTDVSSGAIYTTLDRLERRGLLASRHADPSEVRGGRPRRYYSVTPAGHSAIASNCAALSHLSARLMPSKPKA